MSRALTVELVVGLFSPLGVKAHELPRGLALAWHGGAADALPIVLTNRGLIFADGGTFALRCAEAYGATIGQRPYLIAEPDGSALLVVTPLAAQWTDDRACALTAVDGVDADYLGGFAAAADGANLLLTSLAPDAVSQVLGSTNGGRSWTVRSENRASEVFTALAIAPSDAQRVYASGARVDRKAQTVTYLWASSSDAGAHFDVVDLIKKRDVLAVHPTNASIVFATQQTDDVAPSYRLLRSEDAGASFVVVLDALSSVTALAASPDGSTLWIGAGREGGLYRSTDGGMVFSRVYEALHEVHCLYERQGKLWVCGNHAPNVDGVWVSADDGETFEPVLTFPEVTEPVACGAPADSICAGPWHDWATELLPPLSDAGVSSDAGITAPGDDAGEPPHDAAAPTGQPGPKPNKGGGCQTQPGEAHGGLLALGMALALAWERRARRA